MARRDAVDRRHDQKGCRRLFPRESDGVRTRRVREFRRIGGCIQSWRCDAYTADSAGLASLRQTNLDNPDQFIILLGIISKVPLGPATRYDDDAWCNIVRWTVFALIQAEEFGITPRNAEAFLASDDPAIQRLLGIAPDMGEALGANDSWTYDATSQIGSYGEIFDRHLGRGTPLNFPRGINALRTRDSLMYAPTIR
ncbi:MAG: hypothetical protein HOK83_07520 [Rhodospirillaceae bacterium]|nr:hypothetical protein [Rhodospirillaceae bacterium]